MSRLRPPRPALAVLLPLAGFFVASCQKEGGRNVRVAEAAPPPAIAQMTVTATDFHYDAPDTISSGPTTVHLVNHGSQLHHITFVSMAPEKTMKELLAVADTDGPLPEGYKFVGGPNPAGPGMEVSATLDFAPGHYAMMCLIPAPDGVLHVAKGMEREITVIPAKGPVAAMPAADEQLTLVDYGFEFSPDPITAGTHVIRVENHASQPHEAVIVKLEPGKTTDDALAWIAKMDGPPPFTPLGGVSPMNPGVVDVVQLTFTPGDYGLICFVPDKTDRKPHFMHGMVRAIHVSEPAATTS